MTAGAVLDIARTLAEARTVGQLVIQQRDAERERADAAEATVARIADAADSYTPLVAFDRICRILAEVEL